MADTSQVFVNQYPGVLGVPRSSSSVRATLKNYVRTPDDAATAASTPVAGAVATTDVWAEITPPGCTTSSYLLIAKSGQTFAAGILGAVPAV